MGIYGCIAVRDAFSRTFYPLLYRYSLVGVPRSSPPSSKSLSASFRPIYLVQLCWYIHNYLYLVSISYISTIIILYIVVSAYSAPSPVAPTLYLVGTTILYTTSRILLYLVYTPISTHYILGTTISCTFLAPAAFMQYCITQYIVVPKSNLEIPRDSRFCCPPNNNYVVQRNA